MGEKKERKAVLNIRVIDENGKERQPGKNDRVEINHWRKRDPRDKVLTWAPADGFFYELRGGEDEIVLSIEYEGFATLLQWFVYKSPADQPVFKAFWPGKTNDPGSDVGKRWYLLECMKMSRAKGGDDKKRSWDVISLTVTLAPTREHIAVIGTDYYDGHGKRKDLDFDRYALTYHKHLWENGATNNSSPFTMLRCDTGRRITYMRATRLGVGKGWQPQTSVTVADQAKWSRLSKYRRWSEDLVVNPSDAANYLGATAIYRFVSDIGKKRPKTVIDFGVFSHAGHSGPILFNTFDDSSDPRERDEADLDMRFVKDFIDPNKKKWKHMPDAFHADGVVRIWGCFNTDAFDAMTKQLIRDKKWPFKYVEKDRRGNVTYSFGPADRDAVAKELNRVIDRSSYMKRIASFVKRPAWGGLPGFGSEHVSYDELEEIEDELRKEINGPVMHVVVIARPSHYGKFYKKIRPLFESAELKSREFDDFGYMKYQP